ncbi:MAG TPA: metal ABC transporter substrate-binding protein [Longimicrobiales bacterium]|nr:metal ABC transporter substrate-binding protein [Longimicrobiales bacterium]
MRTLRFLAVAVLIAACGDPAPPPPGDGDVVVVASVHPLASIARSLLGDDAVVRTLLPPGVHADAFEPTPRMAEAIAGADLVVRIGLELDDWLGAVPATEVILGDSIPPEFREPAGNPHIWLDPILVRDRILPVMTRSLLAMVGGSVEGADSVPTDLAAAIRNRAVAFADSLTELDTEIETLLQDIPVRRFIAAHPAWDHFARRYDLTEVGTLHPSPGHEIGTRELAGLVATARREGVRAVIAEPQLGREGVSAVADELKVNVEVADPIGGPGLQGREDYLSLMRFNARAFTRALGANRQGD